MVSEAKGSVRELTQGDATKLGLFARHIAVIPDDRFKEYGRCLRDGIPFDPECETKPQYICPKCGGRPMGFVRHGITLWDFYCPECDVEVDAETREVRQVNGKIELPYRYPLWWNYYKRESLHG